MIHGSVSPARVRLEFPRDLWDTGSLRNMFVNSDNAGAVQPRPCLESAAWTGASADQPPGPSQPAWFCLRTQPKHEHIAAAHLRMEPDLEVYLPRIRFKRPRHQGAVWFTEALFPNYLFARFDLAASLRKVHHARGVRGVVHFGNRWPAIPDAVIADLRARIGADHTYVIDDHVQPGDAVAIAGGLLHGWHAVVTRVMPGRERVAVLLELLGRQTSVELPSAAVVLQDGWKSLI